MLRLSAALAAAAFFLVVPASAAVVQIDVLGKATHVRQPNLEWMTRHVPYAFVDLEPQVTRFTGVGTGDEVRFRLTYDSDAVTAEFDEWYGAQEYLMTLPGNASAVLTVGGASYDGLPPGHHGNWSRLGQYSHGYGRIELKSGRAIDAIVREDGEDRIETVHEDLYAYVQLPNVFDQLGTPLTPALEYSWIGDWHEEFTWEYSLLTPEGDTDFYGINFVPTSMTSRVLNDAPAPVPLPAGLPMLAGALIGLGVLRRRARA